MDESMNFVAPLLAVVVGVLSGFFKNPPLSSALTRSNLLLTVKCEAAKRLLRMQAILRVGVVSCPEEVVISGF